VAAIEERGGLPALEQAPAGKGRIGYTVGEAARRVGVSAATLRVWEREGLITSERSPSGYRRFREADLSRLRRIAHLRRVERLNTAGIRRVLQAEAPRAMDRGEVELGPRLRRLRQERGLTLAKAAAAVGLSASFLSELERDRTGVAMATLHRLLDSYGTTLAVLLGPTDVAARPHRAGSGPRVRNQGVTVEQLAQPEAVMEPQLFTVEPGAGSDGAYTHEGEEFIYVLEGRFEVVLGGRELHVLDAGDSLYYPSTMEHAWRNPGCSPARLIWVNTPPTF
jgi:DNA-binding transcriptional MerR regulator/quercetin dioxygenase-like cupin family protein